MMDVTIRLTTEQGTVRHNIYDLCEIMINV